MMILIDILNYLIKNNIKKLINKYNNVCRVEIKVVEINLEMNINGYFALYNRLFRYININNEKSNEIFYKTISTLYKSFYLLARGKEYYILIIFISFNKIEDYIIENLEKKISENIYKIIFLINKLKKLTKIEFFGILLLKEKNMPYDLYMTKIKFILMKKILKHKIF